MKLSELLLHTSGQYLDDITAMISGEPDQLWPPAALTRWLNDAENIMCRRSWALSSVNNAELGLAAEPENTKLTVISFAAGIRDYKTDPRVLAVRSMHLDDTEIDLVKVPYEEIHPTAFSHVNEEFFDVNSPYTETPGRPQWWAPDVATKLLRFRPVPSADFVAATPTALMRVVHLPVKPLDVKDPDGVPSIPEEYHLDLCIYAAAMALTNANVDPGKTGRVAGRTYVALWEAKLREVRRDRRVFQQVDPRFRFGRWAHDSRT